MVVIIMNRKKVFMVFCFILVFSLVTVSINFFRPSYSVNNDEQVAEQISDHIPGEDIVDSVGKITDDNIVDHITLVDDAGASKVIE